MGTPGKLTYKQKKFTRSLIEGKDIHDSLVTAGLKTTGRDAYGYQLLRKPQILEALKKSGMDDTKIAEALTITLKNGVKNSEKTATASDVIHISELYYRINGMLNNTQYNDSNTLNIQINQYKDMDNKQLIQRIKELSKAINT